MKSADFWSRLPTRAFNYPNRRITGQTAGSVLLSILLSGCTFLPRQHTEYFEKRNTNGRINRFFKIETPIHGSPIQTPIPTSMEMEAYPSAIAM